MSGRLILQEIRLLPRIPGVFAIVALLLIVSAGAAVSGAASLTIAEQSVRTLVDEEQLVRDSLLSALERFEGQGGADQPVAAKPGALGFSVLNEYAAATHASLAPLAAGVSDRLPGYYRLDAHAAYTLAQTSDLSNPLNLRVGSFDFAFVLVFLLPIIVIGLSYNIMSREKELGVLALVGAQGVRLSTFVTSKVVARGLLIVVMIKLACAVAFLVLLIAGRPVDLLSAVLWTTVAVAYGLLWFGLAVFVNSLNLASATNGVVMANLWLILLIVVPAVVNLTATTLYPAPSRVALTTELREAALEAEERAADAREQYFFDHPDMASGDVDQEVFFREVAASEDDIAQSIQSEVDAFVEQAERQSALARKLNYLSPALLADQAFAALAATDRISHEQFRTRAFAFHDEWRRFFLEPLRTEAALTTADWRRLPQFVHEPQPLAERSERALMPALAILVLLLAFLGLAFTRYRHYQPI